VTNEQYVLTSSYKIPHIGDVRSSSKIFDETMGFEEVQTAERTKMDDDN